MFELNVAESAKDFSQRSGTYSIVSYELRGGREGREGGRGERERERERGGGRGEIHMNV